MTTVALPTTLLDLLGFVNHSGFRGPSLTAGWKQPVQRGDGSYVLSELEFLAPQPLQLHTSTAVGLNYYGLPPAGRDHFKNQLRLQAKILFPILWFNQHTTTFDFRKARIDYKGISAPPEAAASKASPQPKPTSLVPRDIFVVTQMRSRLRDVQLN